MSPIISLKMRFFVWGFAAMFVGASIFTLEMRFFSVGLLCNSYALLFARWKRGFWVWVTRILVSETPGWRT